MTGTVKWFSSKKGYGFITGDDGKDYFCHYSSIVMDGYKKLSSQDKVTFEIKETDRDPVAVNVKLAA